MRSSNRDKRNVNIVRVPSISSFLAVIIAVAVFLIIMARHNEYLEPDAADNIIRVSVIALAVSSFILLLSFIIRHSRKRRFRNPSPAWIADERAKVTASVRYDVMKRNGFRCVLCGRSKQDGVILHVDHIIPVSKGGTSDMSNLRTLCSDCNLGKRDKYDLHGPN